MKDSLGMLTLPTFNSLIRFLPSLCEIRAITDQGVLISMRLSSIIRLDSP